MTKQRALAIIATAYNRYFGGSGNAMTPAAAAKLSKGDKLGLLRVYINKADCELYTVAEAESAFALMVEARA